MGEGEVGGRGIVGVGVGEGGTGELSTGVGSELGVFVAIGVGVSIISGPSVASLHDIMIDAIKKRANICPTILTGIQNSLFNVLWQITLVLSCIIKSLKIRLC